MSNPNIILFPRRNAAAQGAPSAIKPVSIDREKGRREYTGKVLREFPGNIAVHLVNFRPASLASWRADLEAADDQEFMLAEVFLSYFRKINTFTHINSYSIKKFGQKFLESLGFDNVYISNGVLIFTAIQLGFQAKCIAGTPFAIFNISCGDLKRLQRSLANTNQCHPSLHRGNFPDG